MNARSGVFGWKCSDWIEAVRAIQTKAMELTGIPVLIGLDSLHGANYILGATIFPHVRHSAR
jgi:beta-glucosidase